MHKSTLAIPLLSLWAVIVLADPQPRSVAAPASAAAAASPAAGSLVGYLRGLDDEVLKRGRRQDKDNPVRYISAYQDLDGDGTPEAIVYMLGRNWCGSGGCSTLILTQKDGSWKQVAEINLSFPAIYVLSDVSHGWHSIAVWTRDMRDNPTGGYEVELRFDGKTYPRNTNYGSRLRGKPAGKLLIASMKDARNEATLLYGK